MDEHVFAPKTIQILLPRHRLLIRPLRHIGGDLGFPLLSLDVSGSRSVEWNIVQLSRYHGTIRILAEQVAE